jgi:hypothetical protein
MGVGIAVIVYLLDVVVFDGLELINDITEERLIVVYDPQWLHSLEEWNLLL